MDLINFVEQRSNDIAKWSIAVQNFRCLQSKLKGKQGWIHRPKDLPKDETFLVHLSLPTY